MMKQSGEDSALTPKQRMAAELLGSGMSRREAAERVGVHETTISHWRKNPAFCELREETLAAFIGEMRMRAWDVFARQLEDEDKKIAQQAAAQVLKLAEQTVERDKPAIVRFLYMPMPGAVKDGSLGNA